MRDMMSGAYAPVFEETVCDRLEIQGEIPSDLNGVYLRNGPNPRFTPQGRYHWFDGDGMLHAAHFDRGRLTYRNRWVRTDAFAREEAEHRALYWGVMESHKERGDKPMKDSANTDVIGHGGVALASWYLAGDIYRVDPLTLQTLGKLPLEGSLSAHPKVDLTTGELMYFDYQNEAPYMSYGVIGADGTPKHRVPIDLPGARLPHDMAITERYSILHDLPLFHDMDALRAGRHKIDFHADLPARFGIIPRCGASGSIRWFEAPPCWLYHTVNAWEEGDEVVMLACRYMPARDARGAIDERKTARMIAELQMDARLCRWRFNLKTGGTKEEIVDPEHNLEFPTGNARRIGRRSRWAYLMEQTRETPHFTALVKQDIDSGATQRWSDGPGSYYSEAPFAPADHAAAEHDGYLVTFVWSEKTKRSEIQVFDARDVAGGPVARARVPQRVPAGFHAAWIEAGHMAKRHAAPGRSRHAA